MKLFSNNKTFHQFQFSLESDFEKEVVLNSKQFFGSNSIYIDAKRKIQTKSIGNSIPDGFLFDLSDKKNPEFYIVEVELAKHDFYSHIFPQITKFFGFYKNFKSQNELVEKIFQFISNDEDLKKEFKKFLGEKEIYKFVKDTLDRSQNVLLIIDGEKKELPEIIDTYSDTWGKMLKLIQIKKFTNNGETIYTMHPEFENLEFAEIEDDMLDNSEEVEYTEEFHLTGSTEAVRQIYSELKADMLNANPALLFNPKKHYIAIKKDKNVCFLKFSNKKIRIIVMQSEDKTRIEIKNHTIKSLSASVQKFWNGPSCAMIVETTEHLDEVKTLLRKFAN
jgi:predicted transport protein